MKGNGIFMINYLIELLLNAYMSYETKKNSRNNTKSSILPNYVTKRRIKIYNNGEKVFDSKNVDKIPDDILYTIKSYGIPKNINHNNKTPLVYHINTILSPLFPTEEVEKECFNYLINKTN